MTRDIPLDADHFLFQVHGNLPREVGDFHYLQQTREYLHDTRWAGRISGASGSCPTCGGPLLPSVFPFLYCGKCNCYTCDSHAMAKVHLANNQAEEEGLP